jgi:hypothetical protein
MSIKKKSSAVTPVKAKSYKVESKFGSGGNKSVFEKNEEKRQMIKKKSDERQRVRDEKRSERKKKRKKKRKLRFLNKEYNKATGQNKKNYRSKIIQEGMSDSGGGQSEKEIFYKTKGSDKKQQAKMKTTDPDGNVSMKAVSKKTKGGDYKVYGKDSKKAGSFREAFAKARKAGKSVFTWNGLKYSTKRKGDK